LKNNLSKLKNKLNNDHLVLPLTLISSNGIYKTYSFIDTDITEIAFINKIYARNYSFPIHELSRSRILKIIDDRPIIVEIVIYYIFTIASIGSHIELLPLFIIQFGYYPVILNVQWAKFYNVKFNMRYNVVIFNDSYYLQYYLSFNSPIIVSEIINDERWLNATRANNNSTVSEEPQERILFQPNQACIHHWQRAWDRATRSRSALEEPPSRKLVARHTNLHKTENMIII
jgi:hypothetical protein